MHNLRYVRRAIDTLPPEYQQVIALCDLQHLSYSEIARLTGLEVPEVRRRVHYGRKLLRRKLEATLFSWRQGSS